MGALLDVYSPVSLPEKVIFPQANCHVLQAVAGIEPNDPFPTGKS